MHGISLMFILIIDDTVIKTLKYLNLYLYMYLNKDQVQDNTQPIHHTTDTLKPQHIIIHS